MKSGLSFCLVVFALGFCFGQIGFEEHVVIDDTYAARGAISVFAADFDGDGDPDVLSASQLDDKIAWYENLDGYNFGVQQVVETNLYNPNYAFPSDIDGDGDIDIVGGYRFSVAWHENTNGQGSFGQGQLITTNIEGTRSVFAADFDGDGDMDVLSASDISLGDDKIAWYENMDGMGNFGPQQVITLQAANPRDAYAADIDGDGDIDVLSASYNDDEIAWYENTDGMGSFGGQQIISSEAEGAQSVYAIDVDADGDMDVLSASFNDDKIAWYENIDGTGVFGAQQVISSGADGARSVFAVDIDNDGDVDVLSASDKDHKIAWYQNMNGLGNFGAQQVLSINAADAKMVYAYDVNSNGFLDVLSASHHDGKIAWYENTDGLGNFGDERIITQLVINSPLSIVITDIDNDGYKDLISASSNDDKIAWFKNIDGQGDFGEPQVVTVFAEGAISVDFADIDNDGDNDLASASWADNKIAWYENTNGLGNFGDQQIISTNVAMPQHVHTADLDNDGDVDVLSTSFDDNKIAWYENTDGLGSFGPQQIITTNAIEPSVSFTADIDGDEDMDIIYTSWAESKIAWLENVDGLGDFGPQQIITTSADGAVYVQAGDLDNDGDEDVVSTSFVDHKLAWYENIDGTGTFDEQIVITSAVEFPMAHYLTDLDNDGDLDILTASQDEIFWHENIGNASNFDSHLIVDGFSNQARSVYAADIDNDGDNDAVFCFTKGNKIAWYENAGISFLKETLEKQFTLYPIPTQNALTIQSENPIAQIEIYNQLGEMVLVKSAHHTIDISSLPRGIYFCKVVDENDKTGIEKVVKE